MKILAIDSETTGLPEDPTAKVIEIGWAMWDTRLGLANMANMLVASLQPGDFIPPEITEINGISKEKLDLYGVSPKAAYDKVCWIMSQADAIMAANYTFDKEMIGRGCWSALGCVLPNKIWVDFLSDIPFPKNIKGRSLAHSCADHGILNYFQHCALPDAMVMVAACMKGGYDMEAVVKDCCYPLVKLEAMVSYDNNQLAKQAGFYWQPKEKAWLRNIRQNRLEEFLKSCKFKVKDLGLANEG